MENLTLSWSFILDAKKLLIAGLTKTNTPVIVLRPIAGKLDFVIPLCDWKFIIYKLSSDFLNPDSAKKRKIEPGCVTLFTGIHIILNYQQSNKIQQLVFAYKPSWLDHLLAREPEKFSLTLGETLALIDLLPQIEQALNILSSKQLPTEQLEPQKLLTAETDGMEYFFIPDKV